MRNITKKTKTAPYIKHLDIKERFDKIFERDTKKKDNVLNNNRDDDDGNFGGRSPPGSPGIPRPPTIADLFPHEYNNPFNVNLNNLEQEYLNRNLDIETREEPLQVDTNLKKKFLDGDEILVVDGNNYDDVNSYIKQQYIPYSDRRKLKPEIETEIQFFNGGSEGANILLEKLHSDDRIRANEEFVSFLTTDTCCDALQRGNISIHVPTGDIFVNNQNMQESIYTFLENQQDKTKKDIPLIFLMMTI